MNWKQVFCSHIWKQTEVEDINSFTSSFFGFPQSESIEQLWTFTCVKCDKEKFVTQVKKREFTAREKVEKYKNSLK